jgi:hypothetical protein
MSSGDASDALRERLDEWRMWADVKCDVRGLDNEEMRAAIDAKLDEARRERDEWREKFCRASSEAGKRLAAAKAGPDFDGYDVTAMRGAADVLRRIGHGTVASAVDHVSARLSQLVQSREETGR